MIYFVLGIIFCVLLICGHLVLKNHKNKFLNVNRLLLLVGVSSLVFSVAWAYESIVEVEMQAAMMGLIFFNLPALFCLILMYRLGKVKA